MSSLKQGSYIVLARKWRPAQFSDIVGQSHIVRTLMNAVRAQRIHQAYLFTGSRGIGKTSIARILAKAIRCENARWVANSKPNQVAAGAPPEWLASCDKCASCLEIALGTSMDVMEIDGASNNGVEAIREIRENAKYLPSNGTRKIYIIDEVHMLTTAAFNALLKTLEEPPAHVIFIFATTEPHKIPATILSRCQRFDYRRVTVAQIQGRLAEVTENERIETEPGALSLIARAAEGSMRDSLSILDQVIAFSGSKITVQSVRDSVGLVEGQTLTGILSHIFMRQPLEALAWVDQAYQQGHDLKVLTRSLIEFLHAAILAKVGVNDSGLLELSPDEWSELKTMSESRPLEEIEMIFQVFHQGLDWIARAPQPKTVLDVLVVKCATAEGLVFAMGGENPAPLTGGGGGARVEPPKKTIVPEAQASAQTTSIMPSSIGESLKSESATPPVPLESSEAFRTFTWEGFIEKVRGSRPLLASMLENGICVRLPAESKGAPAGKNENPDAFIISFLPKDSYFRDQLGARSYQEQLGALAKEYFGRTVRLLLEIRESGESLADRKSREFETRKKQAREDAQNHPTILEAKALFGGELGPVELGSEGTGNL